MGRNFVLNRIKGEVGVSLKNKQIQRIYVPRHYDLQIMTKTSVKFQKNQHKTVGGVAHTRYPVSINFDSKNARKMPKLK